MNTKKICNESDRNRMCVCFSPALLELLPGLLVTKPASALISCPPCDGGRSSDPPRTEGKDADGVKEDGLILLGWVQDAGFEGVQQVVSRYNLSISLKTQADLAIDALLHSVSEH